MTGLVMSLGGAVILGWLLVAIVSLIGAVAAVVVWVILTMSYQFIPLAIALMIVQMAGATGNETLRKWINRGWGLLWTILLLRPVITTVAELANVQALDKTVQGLVGAVTLLLICAVAPMVDRGDVPARRVRRIRCHARLRHRRAGNRLRGPTRAAGRVRAMAGAGRAQMLAKTLSGASDTPPCPAPADRAAADRPPDPARVGREQRPPGWQRRKGPAGRNGGVTGGGHHRCGPDRPGGAGAVDQFAPPAAAPSHAAASRVPPTRREGQPSGHTRHGGRGDRRPIQPATPRRVPPPRPSRHGDRPTWGANRTARCPGTRVDGAGRAAAATAVAGNVANAMRGKGSARTYRRGSPHPLQPRPATDPSRGPGRIRRDPAKHDWHQRTRCAE